MWTLLTCALSLICAKNPRVAAIYGEPDKDLYAFGAHPEPLQQDCSKPPVLEELQAC